MTRGLRATLKTYGAVLAVIPFGLIAMHAVLFFPDAFWGGGKLRSDNAAQFGDFVGGYVGTGFALVSILLLFITLSNQRHNAAFAHFEAHFFELLKLHRENVAEIQLQRAYGRRIFVLLVREFREIHKVATEVAMTRGFFLSPRDRFVISYNVLFYGIGPNSTRMLKQSLAKFDSAYVDALENKLDDPALKRSVRRRRNLGYKPFEGHQSRLGHYYRHLYQTICYVDDQKIEVNKYRYVKTLRAQLSTHEQALLLLNSLAPVGSNWWAKNFLVQYRLVKNLPRDFFDAETEIDISPWFPKMYFEWEFQPTDSSSSDPVGSIAAGGA
jgi:hypothetical protein